MLSNWAICKQLFVRDMTIYLAQKGEWLNGILFFGLTATLLFIGLEVQGAALLRCVGGIIWVSVLLSMLLALEGLFRLDHQVGFFDQIFLSPAFTPSLLLAKLAAHWCVTGLPLIGLGVLVALGMGLPAPAVWMVAVSLLIGTPGLSCLGAIGAALTLGLPRGGALLALLILPLFVPLLLLGNSAILMSLDGFQSWGQLALMLAMTLAAVGLAPLAINTAIRVSLL